MKNFDPEFMKKLKELEKQNPTFKQLQAVEDIADIVQDIHSTGVDNSELLEQSFDKLGAILLDVRESLMTMSKKEDPKQPEIAKPIIKAIDEMNASLAKELAKIKLDPKITIPKLDVPSVTVKPADVSIDLDKIDKSLKELQKAVVSQIKQLPEPEKVDFSPLLEELQEHKGWLESIDTASRLKPSFPTGLATTSKQDDIITAINGIGGSTTYDIRDIEDTGTYKYFGFGERSGTSWRIMRKELATNAFRYATGATDYATNWTNRGSQTYV